MTTDRCAIFSCRGGLNKTHDVLHFRTHHHPAINFRDEPPQRLWDRYVVKCDNTAPMVAFSVCYQGRKAGRSAAAFVPSLLASASLPRPSSAGTDQRDHIREAGGNFHFAGPRHRQNFFTEESNRRRQDGVHRLSGTEDVLLFSQDPRQHSKLRASRRGHVGRGRLVGRRASAERIPPRRRHCRSARELFCGGESIEFVVYCVLSVGCCNILCPAMFLAIRGALIA